MKLEEEDDRSKKNKQKKREDLKVTNIILNIYGKADIYIYYDCKKERTGKLYIYI